MNRLFFRAASMVIISIGCWLSAATTIAQDFRVQNQVFQGKDEAPVSESLTLFRGGVVYDFLSAPEEIVVLDLVRGRILLMDPQRKIKTELQSKDLDQVIESLRTGLASKSDKLSKLWADPGFAEQFDEEKKTITLTSPLLTYRVKTSDGQAQGVVNFYLDFSDASAKLNKLLNPRSSAPFPRMALNAWLRKNQCLPNEVELTLPNTPSLGRTTTLRSEHRLQETLLVSDQKKIRDAENYLTEFKGVGFNAYHQAGANAKEK